VKPYDEKKRLISLHLPKTGGTSLNFALKECFQDSLHLHYIKDGILPAKHEMSPKGVCVHGHFNSKKGAGADLYYPKDKQYITLLRNPLKRQVSYYNYSRFLIREGKISAKNHPVVKASNINEFIINCKPNIFKFFPSFVNKDNFKESIEEYFVQVLILENFQDSLNILTNKIAKPKVLVKHSNRVKKKEKPSLEAMEIFRTKNKIEFRLYNFCKNLKA